MRVTYNYEDWNYVNKKKDTVLKLFYNFFQGMSLEKQTIYYSKQQFDFVVFLFSKLLKILISFSWQTEL